MRPTPRLSRRRLWMEPPVRRGVRRWAQKQLEGPGRATTWRAQTRRSRRRRTQPIFGGDSRRPSNRCACRRRRPLTRASRERPLGAVRRIARLLKTVGILLPSSPHSLCSPSLLYRERPTTLLNACSFRRYIIRRHVNPFVKFSLNAL